MTSRRGTKLNRGAQSARAQSARAQSRGAQSREPQSRELQSREPQSREPQSREPQSREPQSREPQSRGAQPLRTQTSPPAVQPARTAVDPTDQLFEHGVTDGLPVVPPTRERVEGAIAAAGRAADELVALVPPNYGRATVEKIAVNAVMAGCRPEYLPVVLAAVEAVCDEAFDLHGVSATTNAPAPLLVINGPLRKTLDVNCGAGVFGPGWRANATIGRAVRLVCVNVGGATPGVVSMSTLAHPGRYTYCIGEWEEQNPWEPLHVEHGFPPGESTVAALAADAPLGVYDHASRTAPDLLSTIAASMAVIGHHKMTHWGDTLLVIGPEHARTIAGDGFGKADVRRFLFERLQRPVRELLPGRDGGEGLPEHVLRKFAEPEREETRVPKFRAPEHIKIVVAGGTAGRFSAIVPGWSFPKGSNLVLRRIR